MMILGTNVEVLKNGVQISRTTAPQFEEYFAFTVAELGEMLPDEYPGHSESDLNIFKITDFEKKLLLQISAEV